MSSRARRHLTALVVVLVIGMAIPVGPAMGQTPTAPTPPTALFALPGPASGQATLTWLLPGDDGGAAITGYTVTAAPGGATCVTTTALTCVVSGLDPGTVYTFTATASNAVGTSGPSHPSLPVLVTGCNAGTGPGPFPDVGQAHPFCLEIEWLAGSGIGSGFADGTFRPANTVTRQAAAAFLYRAAGQPAFTPPSTPSFPDVGVGHPFRLEVEWLVAQGIAEGFADGTFRPIGPVSRQALAAFLARYAGVAFVDVPAGPSFSDVGFEHPFFDEIEWLAGEGLAGGFPDGSFQPTAPLTRQATAAFFFRFIV